MVKACPEDVGSQFPPWESRELLPPYFLAWKRRNKRGERHLEISVCLKKENKFLQQGSHLFSLWETGMALASIMCAKTIKTATLKYFQCCYLK